MTHDDRPLVALVDWADEFWPMGFEEERLAAAGARWVQQRCLTEEEMLAVARDALVIIVQSTRPLLTHRTISQLTRCRCMVRAGAGFDSIDVAAATERGIMVCNTPTYCTDEVADHAIALLLACLRHVAQLDRGLRRGDHAMTIIDHTRRVAGSTLGIVGFGRIGRRVAQRMQGWDLRILAYDPYIDDEQAQQAGAEKVSLDELLRQSDFISVHLPLTPDTHHLIGQRELALCKPTAILVNDARGQVIDEAALIKALREERLWGAGLDVFATEPLPGDSPLLTLENVVLTPHAAAYSPQSRADLYALMCEIGSDVAQGRTPRFVVNPEVLR
ncbi:MAG: C-terminal binding protein [Chloroflexi bacterium]|jgi:D-3-phosphoglycerate dehydrogenase|nr:C-terminal binding protein [Chloroflexota bacterium]